MINSYQQPQNFDIPDNVWWMVYEDDSKEILSGIRKPQERGCITSPLILLTADTKEELEQYIQDNGLILPPDPYNSFPTYNIG
jgi:hypothetical protein